MEVGETVHEAAVREAAEETGLAVEVSRLVGVYSEPDRDPRGHNVSVAFLVRVLGGQVQASCLMSGGAHPYPEWRCCTSDW